jgi:molecular chaperone DnaK (HSP70)
MGRIVAIKVLPHAAERTAEVVERFRREVKAAARLLHPNIVTAFDAGELDETQFLVMEYVDGQSLFEIVQENGPIPLGQATGYIIEAAQGLEYAHSQRIIHRDIKPGNIMVDRSGRTKILDMGLARLQSVTSQGADASIGPDLTEHGLVIGTVGYIAPEQIVDAHDVDERTDIYGLGCTYHFLLTGSPPYSGSVMQTLLAHTQQPVPSVCEKRADLPPALDITFRRMLAKKPADRFATMGELIADLESLMGGVSSSAGVDITPEIREPSRRAIVKDTSITAKAVGFDVGTTNAYASWIGEEGVPVPITNQHGSASTPSVVAFKEETFQFGEIALQSAKDGVSNIADHFVCKLGTTGSGISFRGKEVPVELLTAVLVHKLAEQAKRKIGYFSHLAYTVPGCFGEVQRKAYHDAYKIASLNTLDPINAATAVAVYFSFLQGWLNPQRTAPTKTLLVFRYGAGSFDATVYRVDDRQITTLSVAGDSTLGGRVWDERIAESVAGQLADKHGVDISDDPAKLFELRQQCETAKVALSDQDRILVRFQAQDKTLEGILSRAFLSRLGSDLLSRPKELTEQALSAAGVTWQDLDHVLLAGGASRMSLVQEMVQEWVGTSGICSLIGSEAAPQGAALYAQIQLAPNLPNLDFDVQEVKSHYLGIVGVNRRTGEKQMSVVIPQNVALPATAQSTFTTVQDGQTSLALDIVEGSDPTSPDYRPIGRCHISNLPPGMPKGTSIAFDFLVASNGILSVSIESAATGQRTSPQIQRASGMTTEERNQWRDWLQTGLICGQFD